MLICIRRKFIVRMQVRPVCAAGAEAIIQCQPPRTPAVMWFRWLIQGVIAQWLTLLKVSTHDLQLSNLRVLNGSDRRERKQRLWVVADCRSSNLQVLNSQSLKFRV